MKSKLLIFIFLFFTSHSVMGQGTITRNSTRKTAQPQRKQVQSNQKKSTKPQSQPTGYANGHEWVDLGLSVKWATCNVGASVSSDYGDYFAWGETSTKSHYDWNNCFDCLDEFGKSWDTYKQGGKTRITPSSGHDTARENWGGKWRIPTVDEFEELIKKCKWTWIRINGHDGYLITGPNDYSIFLPAAGVRHTKNSHYIGESGYYWASMLGTSDSYRAYYLHYNCNNRNIDVFHRDYGLCVRPVTD